jgi:hypothetical protein
MTFKGLACRQVSRDVRLDRVIVGRFVCKEGDYFLIANDGDKRIWYMEIATAETWPSGVKPV